MSSKASVFSPVVLQKVLAFQLATKLTSLISTIYPCLLKHCQAICDRLQPVRVSEHGRKLRAWGRDYRFTNDLAPFVCQLVQQFELGLSVDLPASCLKDHPATIDGVLRCDDGCCWLQEPDAEAEKPVLVLYTADADPYAGLDKEVLALAWLQVCPEWTNEQIANKIGLARTSLNRMDKFMAARAVMKEGRQAFKEWQQQ